MARRLIKGNNWIPGLLGLALAAVGPAVDVSAQTVGEAPLPEWYFVGGGSDGASRGFPGPTAVSVGPGDWRGGTQSHITGGDLLSLGGDEPERFEFVLVLSDTADLDQLGLSSGQSLSISVPRDSYTFFVNRSVEVDLGTSVTPHFMAGLGLTYQVPPGEEPLGLVDGENWQPALQLGVGASYDLSEQFAITARLRAFYLGGDAVGERGTLDRQFSQDFFVGARIRF